MVSPDPQQQLVVRHRGGPLLVRGEAGTGKTTALLELFATLIDEGADPERVALVVRSRRARDEARAALIPRVPGSLPVLHVLTIQGLAFHVVSATFEALDYPAPPTVLSAPDQFARVRDLLRGERPADWPAYGGMLELRGFADEVRQFLLRAQEALLRPDDIEREARRRDLAGWLELAGFYRTYQRVLDDGREVDFAGLVEQAASSARRIDPMFDHLLVDDYQDTTIGAEALLSGLRPASLVVAGDLDSHVFGFQGFTDAPLRRFAQRFPGGEEARLTTPHRAPEDRRLEAWSTSHTSEEHAAIARELRRIHVWEGVGWSGIAVVVRRQGAQMAGLLRALDDAGVPRASPEAAGSLSLAPATAPYVLALRWIARPDERDGLVEALLTSDLARLSPAETRALVRHARTSGAEPGVALEHGAELPGDAGERVSSLADVLARAGAVAGASVLDAFAILWRDLACSRRLVERAAEGSVQAQRDLDDVMVLSRAVARAGESAEPSTEGFLSSLDAGEQGPGLAAAAEEEGAVRVLTAHATAGRQFDTVVVAGAVEGSFPSLTRPAPMFDLGALDAPISQSERNRVRLDDERRLFGLVVGRARRRVLFTASDERDAEAVVSTRSRFVERLGVTWVPAPLAPFDDPLTAAEATAAWRRTLAEHGAPAPERLASLDGLLSLGSRPDRWWFQREWTDTGAPLREHVRVSATKLSTLENCELQFVLAQELGLDPSSGYHAWVGQMVHRIIEECERGELPRELGALVAAAEERWRPDRFPSMAVSETFRRLVVEQMLPQWFEEYGGEPALAAEEHFEFEFEGATVSGVIDRIGPAQPSGSQITDYKTGRPQHGNADENLQLGMYYLAVHEDESLNRFLPVRGVELAFVREVSKFEGDIARMAKGFTRSREPEYEELQRETLAGLISRVRAIYETGTIRPNPGAECRFCSFQPLCPLFPEGAGPLHAARGEGTRRGAGA